MKWNFELPFSYLVDEFITAVGLSHLRPFFQQLACLLVQLLLSLSCLLFQPCQDVGRILGLSGFF